MEKIGKYELHEVLGRGGMGVVYRAYDPAIDRAVAVKIIQDKELDSPEIRARFVREARTAGKLSHENITTIHDLGESGGKTFIVMEYLPGRDLRSYIKEQTPLSLAEKVDIAKQICRGLRYAHTNNIVHRDIKPENIKVLADGRIKIMDFGIAKPYSPGGAPQEADTGAVLTKVGVRVGTPWYMSPEQVKGSPVDKRSDIFSFGVLLYELLTYKKPFDGDDTTVLYKILHEEPEPIRLEESGLVVGLQKILARCLAKKPASRYADCQLVLRDLENFMTHGDPAWQIHELIADGEKLAGQRRFDEALLKLHEAVELDPSNEEARAAMERVAAQRRAASPGTLPERKPGEIVSHFRIIERISGGGMGMVYKAEDLTLKRIVALKFLLSDRLADADSKKRFLQEARAASALDHPNICTIHEIGETADGMLFICMTYYQGENLSARLKRGPLEIPEALGVCIRVARGLAKSHEFGIVHRDIKPANIIVTPDDEVKIVDFGVAKLSGGTAITKIGSLIGTVPYMSPEQVKGQELDHRSDIWSAGVLVYQLLTGRLPFQGQNEPAVFYSIVHGTYAAPSTHRPDLPSELDRIVGKALQKGITDRYQTMKEFLADLEPVHEQLSRTQSFGAARSAEFQRLVENGKIYLKRGEYGEAKTRFDAALQISPADREIQALRDQCAAKLEGARKANDLLTQARTFLARGKVNEARELLQTSIGLDPENLEATRLMDKTVVAESRQEEVDKLLVEAEVHQKRGRPDAAATNYRKILEADPQNKEALKGLRRTEKQGTRITSPGRVMPGAGGPSRTVLLVGGGIALVAVVVVVVLLVFSGGPGDPEHAVITPAAVDSAALVNSAKDQMLMRKAAATTAGAETHAAPLWKKALENEQRADRATGERSYTLAREKYREANSGYSSAAEESERASLAATAGITELKTLIANVRGEMLSEKQKAESAGAREGASFRNAETRERQGDQLIRSETREDLLRARTAYTGARDGYRNAASEVRLTQQLRGEADARRSDMRAAKNTVQGSESEKQGSPSYRSALAAEQQAQRQYNAQDFRNARDGFAEARRLFSSAGNEVLAGRSAAAESAKPPVETRQPERVDPAARERAELETAQRQIRRMVDLYKDNIEQGNLKALSDLLNLGASGQQEWSGFFEVSRDRKVSIDGVETDVSGATARVSFRMKMSFYNETASTTQTIENPRQWTLESRNGQWVVVTQR